MTACSSGASPAALESFRVTEVQGYAHTAEPSAHPQIGEIIRVRALG
jgi:hypothetical protein